MFNDIFVINGIVVISGECEKCGTENRFCIPITQRNSVLHCVHCLHVMYAPPHVTERQKEELIKKIAPVAREGLRASWDGKDLYTYDCLYRGGVTCTE